MFDGGAGCIIDKMLELENEADRQLRWMCSKPRGFQWFSSAYARLGVDGMCRDDRPLERLIERGLVADGGRGFIVTEAGWTKATSANTTHCRTCRC